MPTKATKLSTVLLLWVTVFALLPFVAYAKHPISSKGLPKAAGSMSPLYPTYPVIDYGTGDAAKLVKRGEYLARAGDCIACHTDTTTGSKAFAGGLAIKTPFGTFYSPNISPDKETGIGKWKFADFVRAMHDGKNPKGQNYFPVFPYVYFNKVSKQDLRAIWAYLQKVPAVNQKNKEGTVPFPFNVRLGQLGWKLMFFYPNKGQFKYDPKRTALWNRGKYLVDGLGHCSMCHTPLNFLGAPKQRYYLTGGFIENFWAPNITGYGLAPATPQDVEKVFKQSKLLDNAGKVAGPMAAVNHDSLQYLKDKDLLAIAIYLKSVKSEQPMALTSIPEPRTLGLGRKVYERACSTCHLEGQAGAPRITDSSNWYLRLKTKGISVFYRHAIHGFNNMPLKGGCVNCSNSDIEAAVDYLVTEALTREQLRQLALEKVKPIQTSRAVGKQIYQTHCGACHDNGKLGAQMIGDKKAWAPLIKKGLDVLILNTVKGGAWMPPNGGCKHCSTSEVIAAVKYMVERGKTDGDYSLW